MGRYIRLNDRKYILPHNLLDWCLTLPCRLEKPRMQMSLTSAQALFEIQKIMGFNAIRPPCIVVNLIGRHQLWTKIQFFQQQNHWNCYMPCVSYSLHYPVWRRQEIPTAVVRSWSYPLTWLKWVCTYRCIWYHCHVSCWRRTKLS